MRTLSISMPDKLTQEIDTLTESGSYSSRSEVLRESLRLFLALEKSSSLRMERFSKIPLKEIKAELAKAGHSPKLIKDIAEGFKKSSLYR